MAHGGVQLQVVVGYSNKNVPVIGGLLPPNGPAILAALTSNPPTLYLDGDGRAQYQTGPDVVGLNLMSEEIPIKQVGTGNCAGLLHLHFNMNRSSISFAHVKINALTPGGIAVNPDTWPQPLKNIIY